MSAVACLSTLRSAIKWARMFDGPEAKCKAKTPVGEASPYVTGDVPAEPLF